MKPAEIVTVVVAIPLVAAFLVSEIAASRAPAPSPAVRTAALQALAPVMPNEVVIVARRAASKG